MMNFAPSICWDAKVHRYLEHAFGAPKLKQISEALCRPSLRTCLRVNTLTATPQAVVQQLQRLFPSTHPFVHPAVGSAVIVPGRGPLQPCYELCEGREVVINRLAGEAVLKGAQVYSPGLLAASPGLVAGDLVAVSLALEEQGRRWCGVNRGATLTPQLQMQLADRQQLFVGMGRVTAGRVGLFRQQEGLAVDMTQRVYDIPPCNGVLRGRVMLQALPCIVAAQALNPAPSSRVLDMCAAPGGKTSMLAQIMDDRGTVIALDRTQAKVRQVQELAADWGVTSIQALLADATQLYQEEQPVKRARKAAASGAAVSCSAGNGESTPGQQQQFVQQPLLQLLQQEQEEQQQQLEPKGQQRLAQQLGQTRLLQEHSSSIGSQAVNVLSMASEAGSSNQSSSIAEPHAAYSSTSSSASSSSKSKRRGRSGTDRERPGLSAEVAAAVQPASFDYVLLDAPCSALGLRPRLLVDWTLPALDKLAAYQRALLHSAVHVLKPGGELVYCTCTINPGENEANVRYVLDKWSQMQLVEQPLVLGGPGLVGQQWLTPSEAQLVQRFDPVVGDEDTIGFFIAKFVKTGHTSCAVC